MNSEFRCLKVSIPQTVWRNEKMKRGEIPSVERNNQLRLCSNVPTATGNTLKIH
jgi:hypothetical protein